MKTIGRMLLIIFLIISLFVGMLPSMANSIIYKILYFLLFIINILYFIRIFKGTKKIKVNIFLLVLLLLFIISIFKRDIPEPFYCIGLYLMIVSLHTLNIADFDKKILKIITIIISIFLIPTLIFNGFMNQDLIKGVAFSGRLNPFMYYPFILIAIQIFKNNKFIVLILYLELFLIFIDIIWTESRTALLAIIITFILTKLLELKKIKSINKKNLKKIFLICIILQLLIPRIYIFLYENHYTELNNISYKYTNKYFFSGRQRVWGELYVKIKDNKLWGTGDVDYNNMIQTAHNEFLNLYYCWGIIITLMIYIYIYIICKKCIKNASDNIDYIILSSIISTIICTMFETYMFTIHFYIYEGILICYLLNKKKEVDISE